jgi:hypothetical protein
MTVVSQNFQFGETFCTFSDVLAIQSSVNNPAKSFIFQSELGQLESWSQFMEDQVKHDQIH